MTASDDFKAALNRYEREHFKWSEDSEATNWEECKAARDNLVAIFEEQNTRLRLILEIIDQIFTDTGHHEGIIMRSPYDKTPVTHGLLNMLYNQTDDLLKALRSGNVST